MVNPFLFMPSTTRKREVSNGNNKKVDLNQRYPLNPTLFLRPELTPKGVGLNKKAKVIIVTKMEKEKEAFF